MKITLTPETQRLLENQMRRGGYDSPEDVLRAALEAMELVEGEPIEQLDPETVAAIERAEWQADRGEGISIDEAFARIRGKHLGGR